MPAPTPPPLAPYTSGAGKPSTSGQTYTKLARTPSDLLLHLEHRGLVIADPSAALRALEQLGYYRLLIYCRGLQSGGGRWFNPGASFEQVLELYEFDRQLRLLCFDAIERIEVALRAAISSTVAVTLGPHFYQDSWHFVSAAWFDHAKLLQKIDAAHSLGIEHYRHRYTAPPRPPVWVILEAITFGTLSRLFSGLIPTHRDLVAKQFSLPTPVLVSWFRALNGLRNVCAHHGRLWATHLLVDQPIAARAYASDFPSVTSPYARLVVASVLLADVDPKASNWRRQVVGLFHRFPTVSPHHLGCPAGWDARPVWS
ncbi:Abi family protein [Gemmatimonas sp.]|uniref:Abi family protein n=1 Tax=Gemmatimonas sp. TaxID=1962908 RepID=UPI00333E25E4